MCNSEEIFIRRFSRLECWARRPNGRETIPKQYVLYKIQTNALHFFFKNVITGVLDLVHITVLPNAEHTVRVVLLVLKGMTTRYISYHNRKTILNKVHLMHVIFMWLKLLRTLKLRHSLKVTWKKMQKFVFFRWFIFV